MKLFHPHLLLSHPPLHALPQWIYKSSKLPRKGLWVHLDKANQNPHIRGRTIQSQASVFRSFWMAKWPGANRYKLGIFLVTFFARERLYLSLCPILCQHRWHPTEIPQRLLTLQIYTQTIGVWWPWELLMDSTAITFCSLGTQLQFMFYVADTPHFRNWNLPLPALTAPCNYLLSLSPEPLALALVPLFFWILSFCLALSILPHFCHVYFHFDTNAAPLLLLTTQHGYFQTTQKTDQSSCTSRKC